MRLSVAVLLLLCGELCAAVIDITGGTLTIPSGTFGQPFQLIGVSRENGSLFSATGGNGERGRFADFDFPNTLGGNVSMNAIVAASSLGSGPATVNGKSYGEVFFGGQFEFTAEDITLLPGVTTYTQPFTFAGFLIGFSRNPFGCTETCEILFDDLQLNGRGRVTLIVDPAGDAVQFVSETFEFVVPEPGSLSLVGLGIALVALRWRKI